MRLLDLFSGCGGMSQGFQNAGFEVVAAFDNWKPALKTYRRNFLNHPIFDCDLGKVQGDFKFFRALEPEIIIGGPPCQDFSSAGKRDESLGRADLTASFAQIVTGILPAWFVMENVERAKDSQAWTKAYKLFKDVGYGLTETVLDASLCGVPQKRKRVFLIGQLQGGDRVLLPYLKKKLAVKPMTIRDYLGTKLEVEHFYRHPRSYQRRAIFSIDEPSPTIRGVNRPIPPNYQPHPGDSVAVTSALRTLTTKERSLIQTFPESFILEGTKSDLEQMIGNAVPVKLAEYVARCLLEYIEHGQSFEINNPVFEQLSFTMSNY